MTFSLQLLVEDLTRLHSVCDRPKTEECFTEATTLKQWRFRILLIEDGGILRYARHQALESVGYEVISVSGSANLSDHAFGCFDLVALSLRSGQTLRRRVERILASTPSVSVVVMVRSSLHSLPGEVRQIAPCTEALIEAADSARHYSA